MSSVQKSPRPNPFKKNIHTQQNDKDLALRQQCDRLGGLVNNTRRSRVRQSQIITSEYNMIMTTDEEEFSIILYASEWGYIDNKTQKADTLRPHQASLFIDNAISDAIGYGGKYHG